MKIRLFSAVLLAALVGMFSSPAIAQFIPHSTALPQLSPAPTLPPVSATATPTPQGRLLRYSGMLLSADRNFAFFTSGDGFRLDPTCRFVDAVSAQPTNITARTRVYARATFDASSGSIVELALSRTPLPTEASYQEIAHFAIARSTPAPNSDLKGDGPAFNGKWVTVIFRVQVPTTTALSDDVYLATDQSNWNPRAIKLDRIDALHYRATARLSSGTVLNYRYTRGSWTSTERGPTGLEEPPHSFTVQNLDVMQRNDTVAHWNDENMGAPQAGPQNIPTPFNARPFPIIP
ncbi:MAG TPA: hypothetical protein VGZ00_03695 [Candidatus Baltobacteraceae bacterium]|nr:hypothetical protein [Candidatus Baltobacteraceae bacterium]